MEGRSRTPERQRTRGIRGGRAAQRKRAAYIAHHVQETGKSPSEISVLHSDGTARPLYSSRYWVPSGGEGSDHEKPVPAIGACEDDGPSVCQNPLSLPVPEVQHVAPRAKLHSNVRVTGQNPLLRPPLLQAQPKIRPKARPSAAPITPSKVRSAAPITPPKAAPLKAAPSSSLAGPPPSGRGSDLEADPNERNCSVKRGHREDISARFGGSGSFDDFL